MDRIRNHAWASITRACGFGALAIETAMIGAAGTALMAAILLLKAANAPKQPYRKTELWIMLDKDHGLPEAIAQRVLMGTLQECYVHSAKVAGALALALWIVGFFLGLAGF